MRTKIGNGGLKGEAGLGQAVQPQQGEGVTGAQLGIAMAGGDAGGEQRLGLGIAALLGEL